MSYPLPKEFLDRLSQQVPADKWDDVLKSFSKPKPICVRINVLKTSSEKIKKLLDEEHISYKKLPLVPHALLLPYENSKKITELECYKNGSLYIQSPSSMIPAFTLDPHPGEKILDMAAAPGSKTTQMAIMMRNKGEIIANDIDQNRIFRLKSILALQGITNTTVTRMPAQAIWKTYPQYFDKVLLDAPCSMEGMFNTQDPKSFQHWSLKKVKSLSKLQKWMLRSAVSAAKVGGTIVYSTCTLSPEENEEVIKWILEKEKETIILAGSKKILPDIIRTGFFIAKLKKIKSNTLC